MERIREEAQQHLMRPEFIPMREDSPDYLRLIAPSSAFPGMIGKFEIFIHSTSSLSWPECLVVVHRALEMKGLPDIPQEFPRRTIQSMSIGEISGYHREKSDFLG